MRSLIARTGICAVALAAAALGGCATPGETGAVTGAVLGGVAGHAIGGGTAGTVIGAGAGALIGNRIGRDYYYDRGYYYSY
jgi:osmotically inducible lipoprotein OsmB